ncbi:uncharacterized protein VTP21DRAFT_8414 [Calcarisporiella thermophila]|uniref:uncharacterized protein n=1 Tax=Calcarisporiella thermophila TaxID=911321 RepID=UPI003743D5E2
MSGHFPKQKDCSNLQIRAASPYNAEPRCLDSLTAGVITSLPHFFVRNHGPMPRLDSSKHEVEILVGGKLMKKLTLVELKQNYQQVEVTVALQCAGNRRESMNKIRKVSGLLWGEGAIGNAVWKGCRLCDVLLSCGINYNLSHHVAFEGCDMCEEGEKYEASIPLSKAMDPAGDVILAYEMNGAPLTLEHGYPVRAIVPGFIGARSVKYLAKIKVQADESSSYWQKRDYKILPQNVLNEEQAATEWCKRPALQECNIQCVICSPHSGTLLPRGGSPYTVRGYAYSGGGAKVLEVRVSPDGGNSWVCAELDGQADEKDGRAWGWVIWKARMHLKPGAKVLAQAIDSRGNVQPESGWWNMRGIMNNVVSVVEVGEAPSRI